MSSRNFYIFIDSRNKFYGSNSNFSISLAELNIRAGVTCSLSLDSCTFLNMQYPINSSNNVFTWRENADDVTTITSTLTPGNYAADEFKTLLQDKMNADTLVANVYTVAFDENTSKLTVSTPVADTFKFVSINEIYGFNNMTSFLSTKTADNPINLSGVDWVDITFPGLLSNGNLTTNRYNTNGIFARVSLNGAFGDLITYRSSEDDDSMIVSADRIDNMNIRIRNPDGSDYDLPDNIHVNIVLRCSLVGQI